MRFLKVAIAALLGLVLVTSVGLAQGNPGNSPNVTPIQLVYPGRADSAASVVSSPAANTPPSENVTYENGKLSISAENSTLMDVLHAVQAKTGAALDAAGIIDTSRVTVKIGPDNFCKVLGVLLYGTRLNYIIVASADNRHLAKIVLMPKNDLPMVSVTAAAAPVVPVTAKDVATTEEKLIADGKEAEDPNAAKDDKKKDDDADKDKKLAKDKKTDANTDDKAVALAKPDANSQEGGDLTDDTTLGPSASDRLANMPANINPAIAALYPSLFSPASGNSQSSSPFSSGNTTASPGVPTGNSQASQGTYNPIGSLPTDAAGNPILPSNIPNEMWGLYPPNLMQLVHSNTAPPVVATTPLSPTLPTTSVGQPIFWDQSIKGPH
jgi:hypothetical protein